MQEFVDLAITGVPSNQLYSMLKHRSDEVLSKIPSEPARSISRNVDTQVLHTLFKELEPFLTQVVFSSKMASLLREESSSGSTESSTMQANISGFISRLEVDYRSLKDIIQPIIMALVYLNFGLDMLRQSTGDQDTLSLTPWAQSLISYPTATAVAAFTKTPPRPAQSVKDLILCLNAFAIEVKLGPLANTEAMQMHQLYNDLASVWLEDIRLQEKLIRESSSLYRHRDTRGDDEEEREFRALFPEFENVILDSESNANSLGPSSTPTGSRFSRGNKERLYQLHLLIMGKNSSSTASTMCEEFWGFRTASLREVLGPELSYDLDRQSLAYQTTLLSKRLRQIGGKAVQPSTFSFYHDPNITEIKEALPILRNLQCRLQELIREWPEQMVLQHLLSICDSVRHMHIETPLAKFVAALEQLILKIEDWEIYSHRENTLKSHQVAISSLIIRWRRLELSHWSNLLQFEENASATAVSEWWIRLYELVISGTLGADDTDLDRFLSDMIPLIEEFITSSPVGQFQARLDLLLSFGQYAKILSVAMNDQSSISLARVSRVLENLHVFYLRFGDSVLRGLREKRKPLEKELADYIRLASWKDINVHALRQSAQRTHRQLFKCLKKYREILRETVSPYLIIKESDEYADAPTDKEAPVCLEFLPSTFPDTTISTSLPQFVQNLPRVFIRFENLVRQNGPSLVDSVSSREVSDFASQILHVSSVLSSETAAAGTNMQLHKTLMMRKRKAWIDLLKELKRAGFSARVTPDVQNQLEDKVHLYDRQLVEVKAGSPFYDSSSKCGEYLDKILQLLPELRGLLSSHHTDVNPLEIQRAYGFLQNVSAMAFAIWQRYLDLTLFSIDDLTFFVSFTTENAAYRSLNFITDRLQQLSKATEIKPVNFDIVTCLRIASKLSMGLLEIYKSCEDICTFRDNAISNTSLQSLADHQSGIEQSRQAIANLCQTLTSSNIQLVTSGEFVPICIVDNPLITIQRKMMRTVSRFSVSPIL